MSFSPQELDKFFSGLDVHCQYHEIVYNLHLNCLGEDDEPKTPELKPVADTYQKLSALFQDEQNKYIEKFVLENIKNYQDLLQFGRYELERVHKNKIKGYLSTTRIETSLYDEDWPILQMIELNKYYYTTASTNHPTELFQEMFVVFQASLDDFAVIKKKLEHTDLKVFIEEEHSYIQPEGLEKLPWAKDFVQIWVEDPILERRNLYQRLIDIFSS